MCFHDFVFCCFYDTGGLAPGREVFCSVPRASSLEGTPEGGAPPTQRTSHPAYYQHFKVEMKCCAVNSHNHRRVYEIRPLLSKLM